MKTLLILGAGTGGTMVANKMSKQLDPREWKIVIVDKDENHYYQPGFLFIPFGIYSQADVVKPKKNFLPNGVETIFGEIELIEPDKNQVKLSGGRTINYDYLVVSTGSYIHPEETDGMLDAYGENVGGASTTEAFGAGHGQRRVQALDVVCVECVGREQVLASDDGYLGLKSRTRSAAQHVSPPDLHQ